MLLKKPFFSLLGTLFTNRFQGPILLAEQTKVLASKPNDPETPGGRGEPRHLLISTLVLWHTCKINVEKCKCNA